MSQIDEYQARLIGDYAEYIQTLRCTPPEGYECAFSIGDTVTFTNENGVVFENKTIIGFSNEPFNDRFIHLDDRHDAYWFPSKASEIS